GVPTRFPPQMYRGPSQDPPSETPAALGTTTSSGLLLPSGGLVIDDEVIRYRRTPDVERVRGRVIRRLPFDIGGDEVDVVRIFGEAPPRIAYITEIIRSDDVPADAPAVEIPAIDHLLHAEADVVQRRDIPARMMKSWPV